MCYAMSFNVKKTGLESNSFLFFRKLHSERFYFCRFIPIKNTTDVGAETKHTGQAMTNIKKSSLERSFCSFR